MKWTFRPVFSDDGQSFTLEKFSYVSKESVLELGPISFDELKELWSTNE